MDAQQTHLLELRSRRVSFDDADGLAATLRRWGAADALQLTRATGENWSLDAEVGALKFRSSFTSGRYHARGGIPSGHVVLQFDYASDAPRRINGLSLGADAYLVGNAGMQFDLISSQHHHGMTLSLPLALIIEALGRRVPGVEELIRPASLQVVTRAAPRVANICALARSMVFQNEGPDCLGFSAFAYGDFVDALIGALTQAFQPGEASRGRTAPYQRLPIVRRVEEFMQANLAEPVQLHHLCVAGRASERAVEYAFRDVYGVGAKQYLKLLRLNEVRRQLKTLPPDVETVAEIAHRHGFWHMGHFSTGYRRLFGETPQSTRGRFDIFRPDLETSKSVQAGRSGLSLA